MGIILPEIIIYCEIYIKKKALDQVLRNCKNNRAAITNLQVVSTVNDGIYCYRAFVTLRPYVKINRTKLFDSLSGIDGLISFKEVELMNEQ